jgi:protein TonB
MTSQIISEFSSSDQLGLSVFASMLLHLVVILGITFAVPKARELPGLPTLEITLVQAQSDQAPENPEFLAQANQAGGGNTAHKETASNPLPVREAAQKPQPVPVMQPAPRPKLVAKHPETEPLTQRAAEKALVPPQPQLQQMQPQLLPDNLGLVERPTLEEERAHLVAEIDRVWNDYEKRPRQKYLHARTREYKYAAYMKAWEAKVERIGNLNYPEEARRRGLSGQLRLDVALNPDGTINSITVRRSSGYAVLDDAARRIVQLAAPFAPFPANIRAETDILHITRTWRFNDGALSQDN